MDHTVPASAQSMNSHNLDTTKRSGCLQQHVENCAASKAIALLCTESASTFINLHKMFSGMRIIERGSIRLQFDLFNGKVYVQVSAKHNTVDIQWFGQTEPFGFTMLPDGETWGPYKFH
jgi:hypothetical protein